MCLTNHVKKDMTYFSSLGIYWMSRDLRNARAVEDHNLTYEFHEMLYSSTAHSSNTFAVGGEDKIRLFTPFSQPATSSTGFHDHTCLKCQGKATAMRFGENGTKLYVATNKGILHIFDSSTKKQVHQQTVAAKTIFSIEIMKNQNQVLFSGHDDQLRLLDIRNLSQPVITFAEHKNNCRKFFVSVDETVGVVCSPGDDLHVRLWSLRTGALLHDFLPFEPLMNLENDFPLTHAVYSNSWRFQEDKSKPVIFCANRNKLSIYS